MTKIVETALTGAFLGTKAAVPAMRRAGGGAIVDMGSIAVTRSGTNPGYAASKAGMLGLTRATATAYAHEGIRCNVCPGHVDTPFIRESRPHSPNDWSTTIDNPEDSAARREHPNGPAGNAGRDRLCLPLPGVRRKPQSSPAQPGGRWRGKPIATAQFPGNARVNGRRPWGAACGSGTRARP